MHTSLVQMAEILGHPGYVWVGFSGMTVMGLAGWLQWRLTWLSSDVEEAAKDGKITPEQAEFRLQMLRRTGPLLMALGALIVLMALAMGFIDSP
jgi:hypothetical protein